MRATGLPGAAPLSGWKRLIVVSSASATYAIIVNEAFNAQGQGGYSNGLAATCKVPEDLSLPFGDPNEGRLSAALSYLRTGACPPIAATNNPMASANARKSAAKASFPAQAFGESSPPASLLD